MLNRRDWSAFSTRRSPTPSFSFSVRLRKVGQPLHSISCKHSVPARFPENAGVNGISHSIEPTEKNPQNPNLHLRGYFDPRRVVSVNQVVAESTYHVTIPHVSIPKGVTAGKSSSKVELGPELIKLPPHFDLKSKGPFGGRFGPGPVRFPPGGHFGHGPVRLPPSETGAKSETLPGFGAFGVGPVIVPGETLGEKKV